MNLTRIHDKARRFGISPELVATIDLDTYYQNLTDAVKGGNLVETQKAIDALTEHLAILKELFNNRHELSVALSERNLQWDNDEN